MVIERRETFRYPLLYPTKYHSVDNTCALSKLLLLEFPKQATRALRCRTKNSPKHTAAPRTVRITQQSSQPHHQGETEKSSSVPLTSRAACLSCTLPRLSRVNAAMVVRLTVAPMGLLSPMADGGIAMNSAASPPPENPRQQPPSSHQSVHTTHTHAQLHTTHRRRTTCASSV